MKKLLIILTFLVSTIFFIDNVSAESIFDSLEDKYYIVHKWVGNASKDGNDYYYVGIFNNMPTIENETIYDSENIIYYKILTRSKLLNFLETGNKVYVDTTTTDKNIMQLNTDSSNMLFSNFDLIDENGNIYFAKKEYAITTVPTDIENYYNITSFYDNDYLDYKEENYYVLKEALDSMLFDDITEWANTSNNYSSKSLKTIKTNISNGSYNSYIEDYGPYYVAYNARTYNGNQICFFKNYDDIYLYRTTSDNNYTFRIYLKDSYCLSYTESDMVSEFEKNGKLDNYTYFTNGFFDKELSLTGGTHTIYYSNEEIVKGILGNELTVTPTIDITKESETTVTILEKEYITDVTLKIDFGSIDNDNYLYMFKYGIDSEWETIKLSQSTSFTKTYSTNDTLYVQVMDRNTGEVVTTSTFGVNSINYDYTPYITIEEITPDACILDEYIICQALQINSHIVDFDRYSFIVIDHTQNTTEEIKEMTVYKTYYVNSTIEVRIVDNTTGEVLEIQSFGIKTISEDTSNLGQHITYSCKFAKYGTNYLCDYYFYNYNQDSYRYYYRTSTSNFVELNIGYGDIWFDKHLLNFYSIKDGLAKLQEVSYNKNTTVYFEIIDKETEEVIYTATFNINYDLQLENADKKDIFDIFKDFNNDNSTIKTLIDNIWTSLKGSTIYEYILILIVGALIVIIIKAANR